MISHQISGSRVRYYCGNGPLTLTLVQEDRKVKKKSRELVTDRIH